jgi:hypothetical protein
MTTKRTSFLEYHLWTNQASSFQSAEAEGKKQRNHKALPEYESKAASVHSSFYRTM